jgi:hypothetical protein
LRQRHQAASAGKRQRRLQVATNFTTALSIDAKLEHDMTVASLDTRFFGKTR